MTDPGLAGMVGRDRSASTIGRKPRRDRRRTWPTGRDDLVNRRERDETQTTSERYQRRNVVSWSGDRRSSPQPVSPPEAGSLFSSGRRAGLRIPGVLLSLPRASRAAPRGLLLPPDDRAGRCAGRRSRAIREREQRKRGGHPPRLAHPRVPDLVAPATALLSDRRSAERLPVVLPRTGRGTRPAPTDGLATRQSARRSSRRGHLLSSITTPLAYSGLGIAGSRSGGSEQGPTRGVVPRIRVPSMERGTAEPRR